MTRFLARFDINFDQWKALTVAALKLDYRTMSVGRLRTGHETKAASAAAVILSQVILYTMMGVAIGALLWFSQDLFTAALIAMTYVTFMIGTAVMQDHNSALTSPDDYGILGFRPVSSRTYFAVRLANVLVYTTAIAALLTLLPVLVLLVKYGLAVGAASVVMFYACATATALAILFVYSTLLKWVGADAIKRALSYVQLIMSFGIYAGFFLTRFASSDLLSGISFPKTPWVLLLPVTWFAAPLNLAAGQAGWFEVTALSLGVIALVAMIAGLGGRLSMDYSERLATITAAGRAAASAKPPRGPGWWFRAGEARAVALLVRSQFRNDAKFRMGVLSILPLTVMYIFMGMGDGGVTDPFSGSPRHNSMSLTTIAIMMFPASLKISLARSDSFRASWIFFATPADRVRIIRASKNVLVAFFLVPYLVGIFAIWTWIVRQPFHVAVHISLLGLLSHLSLQGVTLFDPALPFSRPTGKNRSAGMFGYMIATVALSGVLQAFVFYLYRSVIATVIAFVAVIAASIVVDFLTRARIDLQAKSLEFEG